MTDDQRAAYTAWLEQIEADGVTPPLREYLRWERYDSNVPWRLGAGHLLNLLDQAVEALDDQEKAINFEVTCLNCARTLAVAYTEENRRQQTQALLDDLRYNLAERAYTAPDADDATMLASLDARISSLVAEVNAIAEIVDPVWLTGRILPRMIGAEEMAQVAAIRAVLDAVQEGTGPTAVSENAQGTPPRY